MKTLNIRQIYFCAIVALTFIGAIAWQMSCAQVSDDYNYSLSPVVNGSYDEDGFWNCVGDEYESFGDVVEAMRGHFWDSNSRLSNLVYIAIQFLPVKVVKFFCGLSIGLMYVCLIWLSMGRVAMRKPWLMALSVAVFWFILPWWDTMQSGDFVFNYPVATCILGLWLWWFARLDKVGKNNFLGFCFFTFFFALYHEASTVAALFFMGAKILFGKQSLRGRFIVVEVVIIVALIIMLTAGASSRLQTENTGISTIINNIRWNSVKMFLDFLPGFIAIIITFGAYLLKKISRETFLSDFMPLIFAVVGSILLCFLTGHFGRAFWWGDFFAMIILLKLGLLIHCSKSLSWLGWGALWVFAGLYAWWLGDLVIWQNKVTNIHLKMEEKLSPRGSVSNGLVFMDQIHRADIPSYLMDIPSPVYEKIKLNSYTMARYWLSKDYEDAIFFLPEKYEHMPVDSVPLFPGTARARGDWPYIFLDKPYKGMIRIECGDYPSGNMPFWGILNGLKRLIGHNQTNDMYYYIETFPLKYNDSTLVYATQIDQMPRTLRGRIIEQIDTVQ